MWESAGRNASLLLPDFAAPMDCALGCASGWSEHTAAGSAQVLELITFEHFPPDSPVPDWIRGVIGQKSSDWLKRFLMFATAQPVLPRQVGSLKFIALRHADPGRLPQSHTCFLTVDVPLYTSEEQMATKLEQAISAEGFDIA